MYKYDNILLLINVLSINKTFKTKIKLVKFLLRKEGCSMISINENNKEFHLLGKNISYIFNVMQNGQLGHLYFGKKIKHRDNFSHFFYKQKLE